MYTDAAMALARQAGHVPEFHHTAKASGMEWSIDAYNCTRCGYEVVQIGSTLKLGIYLTWAGELVCEKSTNRQN
jgi:hypothetical protein